MPKVHPIRVFEVRSESNPGKKYKVQYDGARWFCECLSWVNNVEHRGEKGPDGKSVPRECKHTRFALGQMQTRGAASYHEIQPIGPWFEELQEYVGALVELSRNGHVGPEKFKSFRADLERFKTEREKVQESLSAVDTMINVYGSLLRQLAGAL